MASHTLSVRCDDETRTSGVVVGLIDGREVARSPFSGDTCGERIGAAMRRVNRKVEKEVERRG